mgnify:CR=1 FL=1
MFMEKAVLVTSFGTSHKDTREKCLDSIENKVKAKYGSERVERAYTSGVIRQIVKKKEGIHIFDQNEGLEALKNKGYDEIVTMSLHILDGIEYAKLNDKYGKISKPLLVTDEDFEKVEKELGYCLPESYKALMRIQNGGELRKNNFEGPFKRN